METSADIATQALHHDFDLANGALLKAQILHVEDDFQILLIVLHHIAVDGWSLGIVLNELAIMYNSFTDGTPLELPKLEFQYKDYSSWLNNKLAEGKLEKSRKFWLEKLSGELPKLNLPLLKPRPNVQTLNGRAINLPIPEKISKGLTAISNNNQASMFITLVSLLKLLIY